MRDYRVMDKDGRSCMYVIETVETYVSGNRETRKNTTITLQSVMSSPWLQTVNCITNNAIITPPVAASYS